MNLNGVSDHSEAVQLGITPCIIGWVRSPLKKLADCPRWGDNAPEAVVNIKADYTPGLLGIATGQKLVLITWLHLADRTLLQGCKHHDVAKGVFNNRSPDRPNPIGLHEVTIKAIKSQDDGSVQLVVDGLEALDGTPVLDIKRDFYNFLPYLLIGGYRDTSLNIQNIDVSGGVRDLIKSVRITVVLHLSAVAANCSQLDDHGSIRQWSQQCCPPIGLILHGFVSS
uniref:TsaA-like domain-containing protein n=1 Tax=Syphacia muris TaxID=451379 RepID=A0A0N5ASS6_9BILA